MKNYKIPQAIAQSKRISDFQRGLWVLVYCSSHDAPPSVSDLSRRGDVSRTTVYRHLDALSEARLVFFYSESGPGKPSWCISDKPLEESPSFARGVVRVREESVFFAPVPVSAIADERLGLRELGMLARLASHSRSWVFSQRGLVTPEDGITSVRSTLKQLRKLGYLPKKSSSYKINWNPSGLSELGHQMVQARRQGEAMNFFEATSKKLKGMH